MHWYQHHYFYCCEYEFTPPPPPEKKPKLKQTKQNKQYKNQNKNQEKKTCLFFDHQSLLPSLPYWSQIGVICSSLSLSISLPLTLYLSLSFSPPLLLSSPPPSLSAWRPVKCIQYNLLCLWKAVPIHNYFN